MAGIMIVEDSITVRRALRLILEKNGYTIVAEASNGLDAIEKYKKARPDIVTMDIAMPEMNGVDAMKEIRKEFPNAKIIMVSAYKDKELVINSLKFGAKGYILKPIDQKKLIATIESVLQEI